MHNYGIHDVQNFRAAQLCGFKIFPHSQIHTNAHTDGVFVR